VGAVFLACETRKGYLFEEYFKELAVLGYGKGVSFSGYKENIHILEVLERDT